SGKTKLSINIAQHFNCKIINADSRQLYKELQIGSAAPTKEELKLAKHYFVGNLSINENYNVFKYEQDVNNLLNKIFTNENIAILTGGSGLYINAVCYGIDELPDPSPALRKSLQTKYKKEGIESIKTDLKLLDPDYYNKVDLNNPNRIIRAIEVCITSGQQYSKLRLNKIKERPYRILKIGIETERKELHSRINERVEKMISEGLVNEVKSLLPWRNYNALNTVGYKEIFMYLDGKISLNEAIEKIKTNTRRYARRQITWFKKDKDIHWFKIEEETKIIDLIKTYL
ncbi:MAG TPA: tRNA (adenosine(37)-N6)-dimethylallyltransferase MiaA, partial [Bacteroidales bacterium]|nr:tRNA (adenosine(37)-N6)-dimethylallyltransferase MiaA [Bacteroidales bacterium]